MAFEIHALTQMEQYPASILRAVFARKGGELSASDALVPGVLKAHLGGVFLDGEIPILCDRGESHWALLTDRHLVFGDGRQFESIHIADLERSSPDLQISAGLGAGKKAQLSVLKLELFGGRLVRLHLRPGGSYWGWLNVLMRIISKNHPAQGETAPH